MTKARDLANASTALSAVDATELGYLDGVTSNIQTQFGNISGSKAQPTEPASPTDGMIWVDTDGAVTDAQYIANSLLTTTGDTIYASGANTPARLGIGSSGQVLSVSGGVPVWSAAPSGPAFNAYRSGTQQSFSVNTWTKVQFNAENFDTDSCFDSTTNYRFTPNKAGYYQFTSAIQISRTGAAASYGAFYKNGTEVSKIYGNTAMPGSTANNGNAFLAYMNGTTDYMEVYVYDSDASARNVQQDAQNSNFTGVWIRS